MSKVKRQPSESEHIIANEATDKKLISKIYKQLMQLNSWGRFSYPSLLFFGTLYSDAYIFPFLLCFSLLFSSQLFVRPPQTAILLFCISFSWGWSWSLSPIQWSWMVLWRPTRPFRPNTQKRCPFHYRVLECKSRKSRNTLTGKFGLGIWN